MVSMGTAGQAFEHAIDEPQYPCCGGVDLWWLALLLIIWRNNQIEELSREP